MENSIRARIGYKNANFWSMIGFMYFSTEICFFVNGTLSSRPTSKSTFFPEAISHYPLVDTLVSFRSHPLSIINPNWNENCHLQFSPFPEVVGASLRLRWSVWWSQIENWLVFLVRRIRFYAYSIWRLENLMSALFTYMDLGQFNAIVDFVREK